MVNVARSALPLFAGLTSLTAVACAAPEGGSDPSGSRMEAIIAADTISGSLESSKVGEPLNTGDSPTGKPTSSVPARFELLNPTTREVYEVVSFAFGIDPGRPPQTGASTGAPIRLHPPGVPTLLEVSVRTRPGQPPLLGGGFQGGALDSLVLRRAATKLGDKPATFATFEWLEVRNMKSHLEDGMVDTYEIAMAKISLPVPGMPGSVVHHDIVQGLTNGGETCAEMVSSPQRFVHGAAKETKGATLLIDRAEVQLSKENPVDSSGGVIVKKNAGARLDLLAVEGPMNAFGACAFWEVADRLPPSPFPMSIETVGTDPLTGKVSVTPVWQACDAWVHDVHFSWQAGEEPRQRLTFDAAGLLRTAGNTTTGWSFVTNAEITSCAQAYSF